MLLTEESFVITYRVLDRFPKIISWEILEPVLINGEIVRGSILQRTKKKGVPTEYIPTLRFSEEEKDASNPGTITNVVNARPVSLETAFDFQEAIDALNDYIEERTNEE